MGTEVFFSISMQEDGEKVGFRRDWSTVMASFHISWIWKVLHACSSPYGIEGNVDFKGFFRLFCSSEQHCWFSSPVNDEYFFCSQFFPLNNYWIQM